MVEKCLRAYPYSWCEILSSKNHILASFSNKKKKRNGQNAPTQLHLHAEINICIAQPDQQVTVFLSGVLILILRSN